MLIKDGIFNPGELNINNAKKSRKSIVNKNLNGKIL